MKDLQVVCYDQSSTILISGSIRQISCQGCEFLTTSPSTSPDFPRKTQVVLNLLHEPSGKSASVQARLIGVIRKEGAWAYQVRWAELPPLLSDAA